MNGSLLVESNVLNNSQSREYTTLEGFISYMIHHHSYLEGGEDKEISPWSEIESVLRILADNQEFLNNPDVISTLQDHIMLQYQHGALLGAHLLLDLLPENIRILFEHTARVGAIIGVYVIRTVKPEHPLLNTEMERHNFIREIAAKVKGGIAWLEKIPKRTTTWRGGGEKSVEQAIIELSPPTMNSGRFSYEKI